MGVAGKFCLPFSVERSRVGILVSSSVMVVMQDSENTSQHGRLIEENKDHGSSISTNIVWGAGKKMRRNMLWFLLALGLSVQLADWPCRNPAGKYTKKVEV